MYDEKERFYSVKFYDHTGSLFTTIDYTYGQAMNADGVNTPVFIARPDDANLISDYYRYTFKGWITEKDFKNLDKITNPQILDFNKTVTFETSYYPYHVQEDCRTTPSDLDYFDFKWETPVLKQSIHQSNDSNTEEITKSLDKVYAVTLKKKYKNLSGKITLPNKGPDGTPVTAVGKLFEHCDEPAITDIFFLPNA
jgi:hypothetical protein